MLRFKQFNVFKHSSVDKCGFDTDVLNGSLTSPNFPQSPPPNTKCGWNLYQTGITNLNKLLSINFDAQTPTTAGQHGALQVCKLLSDNCRIVDFLIGLGILQPKRDCSFDQTYQCPFNIMD